MRHRRGRVARTGIRLAIPLAAAGCTSTVQSVLHPAGPQAGRASTLWWIALVISSVVWVLVVVALLWGAFRPRGAAESGDAPRIEPPPGGAGREHGTTLVVSIATGVTVAILILWLVLSVSAGHAMSGTQRPGALEISVTGHQWWWEVQYPDTVPSGYITTANEIHIPVGRPVVLRLGSADVIHSFWVPNLNGKRDLIPGHVTSTWFQADTPGVYRGQCAEFCGFQHANMALEVVAESPARFAAWVAQQRRTAPPPADSLRARGEQVFLDGSCAFCHTIAGTPANGHNGPDLTHMASRLTLAAGTLPNNRGSLAGWIIDPNGIKPGTKMPANSMSPQDLQALLAYLETLQ